MILFLIVSNDSINMKPPDEITPEILKLITSISEKIGEVNANFLRFFLIGYNGFEYGKCGFEVELFITCYF